ncbi:MAG: B12-binding domain-containing radical SAM protein [Candidatus Thorarchaeota archaeon]
MSDKTVVFISYVDQDNLGVGYLSSMLISKGYNVEIVDFGLSKVEIYNQLINFNPIIVGFSLIFQYHFYRLEEISRFLRLKGLNCHFTVGGHFPSLRFHDILNSIPYIDSVVRFEGEYIICELVEKILNNEDWKIVKGIAYRSNGNIVSNELVPLIKNLDTLPTPLRMYSNKNSIMGINVATLVASRGCVRNCSFCSIRKFYQIPPGKIRRNRTALNVVEEMKELYKNSDVKIFFFQDDDFLFPGQIGRRWVTDFIYELGKADLFNDILYKISCRADEVDYEIFSKLLNVGLQFVFLGIESGNQNGLETLNKQLSVQSNIKAVEILKKLKITYEFGFMLFDPYSTFESIKENILFLGKICGDGSSPITFCKMVPYAETDIEKKIKNEGRLIGSIITPDYNFLDSELDDLFTYLYKIFYQWIHSKDGILSRIRWHRIELVVLKRFYPHVKNLPEYESFFKKITALLNHLFFFIAENALTIFEKDKAFSQNRLRKLMIYKNKKQQEIVSEWHKGITKFQQN